MNPNTPHALVAAGALPDALTGRQAAVTAEFAVIFAEFAAKANQQQYQTLFGVKKQGKSKPGK